MTQHRVRRTTTLDPAVSALVVLDAQALFMAPDGPFANAGAGPLVGALNDFLPRCRARGVAVVFSNYLLRDDLSDAGLLRDMEAVAAGHWSESSPWTAVDPRIERVASDLEVRHHRPSGFFGSNLEAVLSTLGTRTLLLAGLSVNNAISATARDAFARDLPAVVVGDCVGGAAFESESRVETSLDILDVWTAEVVSAADVVSRLDSSN